MEEFMREHFKRCLKKEIMYCVERIEENDDLYSIGDTVIREYYKGKLTGINTTLLYGGFNEERNILDKIEGKLIERKYDDAKEIIKSWEIR